MNGERAGLGDGLAEGIVCVRGGDAAIGIEIAGDVPVVVVERDIGCAAVPARHVPCRATIARRRERRAPSRSVVPVAHGTGRTLRVRPGMLKINGQQFPPLRLCPQSPCFALATMVSMGIPSFLVHICAHL